MYQLVQADTSPQPRISPLVQGEDVLTFSFGLQMAPLTPGLAGVCHAACVSCLSSAGKASKDFARQGL